MDACMRLKGGKPSPEFGVGLGAHTPVTACFLPTIQTTSFSLGYSIPSVVCLSIMY